MKKNKELKNILNITLTTPPKQFRVWDLLHSRWYLGGTDEKSLSLHTDNVDFFGETLIFQGTGYDQNEDDAWKGSLEIGYIDNSLERFNHLVVLQDTGIVDKNDRHIYEGDLLDFSESHHGVYFVSYDPSTGSYILKNQDNHICEIVPTWDSATIIGNIFENGDKLVCDPPLKRLLKKKLSGKKKEQ